MGIKISVCGKGGSGKSTLVSLLANAAQARGLTTLVVDSDESNSGLFRMLGFNKPPIPLMALNKKFWAVLNKISSEKFVKGKIKSVDFVDDHSVVLGKEEKGGNK